MVKKFKKKRNTVWLTILISIILTVILVSLVNVGISLFLAEPSRDEYFNYSEINAFQSKENMTKEFCENNKGVWYESSYCNDEKCVDFAREGSCDFYTKPQKEYDEAVRPFEQKKFFIFIILGFSLLILGLFHKELLIQITGLSTGGIFVFESVIINLGNKLAVFLALLGVLVIFGILAYRVVRKDKQP